MATNPLYDRDPECENAAVRPGILVVEDEPLVLSFLQAALDKQGFEVYHAGSGREAFDLYALLTDRITLALLDVLMPSMTGPATFKALRQLNPALPCCFMTGLCDPWNEDDLRAMGGRYVFRKPFDMRELLAVLNEVVLEEQQRRNQAR